jgi:hypothetical protein
MSHATLTAIVLTVLFAALSSGLVYRDFHSRSSDGIYWVKEAGIWHHIGKARGVYFVDGELVKPFDVEARKRAAEAFE